MRRSLVVDPRVSAYAQELVAMILGNRDELPRAANGQPIAPSSEYAAQVRKDMRNGASAEVQRFAAVLITDARDGNLFGSLNVLARLEAIIREEAAPSTARPVTALSKEEQRANLSLDLVQQDLREFVDDQATLERAVKFGRMQIVRTEALVKECERKLIVLRGGVAIRDRRTANERGRAEVPMSVAVNQRPRLSVMS